MQPSDSHHYVHDEPWRPGEVERLGRRGFAHRIARTIATRDDPAGLVVALYGAWGEGKTSVLRMVEEDLEAFEDVVPIRFNPWRFRDADHLVGVFFNTLSERLGGAIQLRTRNEAVAEALKRYGKLMKGLPIPYIPNPGEALEAYSDYVGEPSLEELRSRIEAGIQAAQVRPVLFIDDMDRLDAAEIRAVVRLVKLTAGFVNTTYVLAFDPQVVAAALAAAVGAGESTEGHRYLEKIVQVPLQLPAADQNTLFVLMLEYLNEAIRNVDAPFPEGDQQAFVRYVQPLFLASRRTIRDSKRYANAVGFVLPLLAGEVNVGDLLLIEALRAWYPEVHGRLLVHRSLLVGDALREPLFRRGSGQRGEARRSEWAAITSGLDAQEEFAVREALEHLFPFVQAITRNTQYGSEWITRWNSGQRAASQNYLDRYFQYAVPRTDVADRLLQTVEARLVAGDVSAVAALVRAEAGRGATGRLIDKISATVPALTAKGAETLARALAAAGDVFHASGGFLGDWLSPVASVARVVRACVMRMPPEERAPLVLELIRECSLRFSVNIYKWLRAFEAEREQETGPLTADEERRLEAALGERLDAEHGQRPLYRWEPAEERRQLLEWWGMLTGREHTNADLSARIGADPTAAVELLIPFRSHGWGLETGLPTPDVLGEHDYEAVIRLIEPTVVLNALQRSYSESLGVHDEYDPPVGDTAEMAVAHQFAFQHRRALQAAAWRASASGSEPTDDGSSHGEAPRAGK